MGDTVFLNKRSAVHAGSAGKSMAFPDVNLCPPTPPAGPVPLPLPNLAQMADLQGGATSVLVEGNPMGKKSSFVAKSTGNEVAQSTGGGVVSHVVQGKAYFTSYSLDIVVEGEETPRHLDMLTHNHLAQSPPNAAIGTNLAMMDPGAIPPADEEQPERDDETVEFFIDHLEGKPPQGIDAMVLKSADGEYEKVLSAASAPLKGGLYSMKFEKVLPGKFYSLFWEAGGERMPIFENVAFARIAAHTPGAEEEYRAPTDDGEQSADAEADAGAQDQDQEQAEADVDEGEEEDHAAPAEKERWSHETVAPAAVYEQDPALDHPADWYDPDPWDRA
jgi:hypothetical protein